MKTRAQICFSILVILVLVVPPAVTLAASPSPFAGHWQAIDVDGSDIRLVIGGPPTGPFRITWTESYISFCDGEAGIVRGTGVLNEMNAYLLEAELNVECFTTGASMDFHMTFRYHPTTNTLSSRYESGAIVIWHRPGFPPPPPPELGLRVNYGHDWVESFYEAGHTVWITITESDGVTVKATAEVVTEPKDFWDGETGFQTRTEDWDPALPDIQPYDWVYGWVDNGANAQVQIGEISGAIDLQDDSITGTIAAPWFTEPVDVECHPWGAPEQTDMKFDTVFTDGEDVYECTWANEWDIQPHQDVGVGYFGPDGHWVANAFFAPNTRFTVFPEWNYLEGYEWPDGAVVSISVDGKDACSTEAVSGYPEWDPSSTFFSVNFPEGCAIGAGDLITLSFESLSLTHQVQDLAITEVNLDIGTIAGTAVFDPEQYFLHTWIHGVDGSYMQLSAEDGTWLADFGSAGYDLSPGMAGRVELVDRASNATAVEWNIPNPHFTVFPEWEWMDGYEWPDGPVTVSVDGKPECSNEKTSQGGFFNGPFPEGCDITVGDVVTFFDGKTTRNHSVRNLAVSSVDEAYDTVSGTADPYETVYVWQHEPGEQVPVEANEYGEWLADLSGFYDIRPGSSGRSEIRDEAGNATAVDWSVPNPRFTIFPLWEWYDAMDWPQGAMVGVTVENKPECSLNKESPGNFFNGGFPAGCDIAIGDTVTFTDDETTRTHVVRNLAITSIDLDEDTISGFADPGTSVYVWPHDAWFDPLLAVAGDMGEWQVDLGDVGYDILQGASGRSEIRDEAGNATAVDWSLNPRIVVHTMDDWFRAEGFMPNTSLEFWIYEALDGNLILASTTTQTDSSGTISHWVGDQMDIVPGNYVVVSDGTSMRDIVLEKLTFDVFDTTLGILQGTAPEPFGRTVSVGIGCWARDDLTMDVATDENGAWNVDFGTPIPDDYGCVFAWVYDGDDDVSEARPSERSLNVGNFYVAWSQTNPEEILYLSWNGSGNLTNRGAHPYDPDEDLEFFGNSWVSENEGEPSFFFASLVGWGTTGTWAAPTSTDVHIASMSSGFPGSADIPVTTLYQFFDDELRANLVAVQRTFDFGADPYAHDVRPFIPRLFPKDGFTQVLHPDASGENLVIATTDGCGFGCAIADWNGTWFAIHNPDTGMGMIVQHEPSSSPVALWLDDDDGSFTNASSVLLLQPSGGFAGVVTETEYLCFYDSSLWTPSLDLPESCQP